MPKIVTTKDFKLRMKSIFGNEYKLLSEYEGRHSVIHVQHICGYDWWPEAGSFISGHTHCKVCRISTKRKSNKQFIEEVQRLTSGEYYPLTKYVTAKDEVRMYHTVCKNDYPVTPDNFLRGERCPFCNSTKGEKLVANYLNKNNINFEYNYRGSKLRKDMHFDFWIPKYRVAIEYDGKQHFKPVSHFGGIAMFRKQQSNDNWKDLFCFSNKIILIRISYKFNTQSKVNKLLDYHFKDNKQNS